MKLKKKKKNETLHGVSRGNRTKLNLTRNKGSNLCTSDGPCGDGKGDRPGRLEGHPCVGVVGSTGVSDFCLWNVVGRHRGDGNWRVDFKTQGVSRRKPVYTELVHIVYVLCAQDTLRYMRDSRAVTRESSLNTHTNTYLLGITLHTLEEKDLLR